MILRAWKYRSFRARMGPQTEAKFGILITPMMLTRMAAAAVLFMFCAGITTAQPNTINPKIVQIVDQISEARIRAIIERLQAFGTRNTLSNADDPEHGVGAAREWILREFQSYSPRLQVRFDKFRVKKQGQRIFKDVDLWNVLAVLPGTKMPETQVFVSAHYDSLNLGNRPANTDAARLPQLTPADFEKNANLPAPGACDDASGTAAVMELARVMSQYEFDKTLVFVSFAGEEQGLVGSTLESAKLKKDGQVIEAVLNNDIIGTDHSGSGRFGNGAVNIYSDDRMDSLNQQLSRYVKEIGERYLPAFEVNTIFAQDRLGRGGDHTPFQLEGFAAVRVSTPNEIYANQHHDTDLLENMSVPYTARVARLNAAVAASLALAPKPPLVLRMPRPSANSSLTARPAPPRPTPMISRGSGYDAVLEWKPDGREDDIQGYVVVMRSTNAPYWEKEIYAGKVTKITLKDVSIDDVKFGVKAIGSGGESLVSAYVYPPRAKAEYETEP